MASKARGGGGVKTAATLSTSTGTASLAARLRTRIRKHGPIPLTDYMEMCLSDPQGGYYASRLPIGKSGDFITAPEISQIFGELVGLWAVAVWKSMGAPAQLIVAELGPGRGTLMADALGAWRSVPQFLASVAIAMVETSATLRKVQQETLAGSPVPIEWYTRIEDVPEGPLIVLANEFIDALPIRQLIRRGSEWRERCVTLGASGEFTLTDGAAIRDDAALSHTLAESAADGAILELRPAADGCVAHLATRATHAPLAALIVDYGYARPSFGDTLQAVRAHEFADPFAAPGETDLTAHVDFAALKRGAEAQRLAAHGPMAQGEFLLKLGLGARRDRLLQTARADQRDAIASGAARLVDPHKMGVLFKVLALTCGGVPPPPPFAPDI
jgi:NADH dehydrogenase [ubiquinone] 1 alpha subcomplex assembly factor 7